MTVPRSQLVDPEVTRYYHCTSRCVRRAHLCGEGFEHRKQWIERRLEELTGIFAIDVASYSVLDNHLHVVVRLNPDLVNTWSDEEVARRWARLFPRKDKRGEPLPVTDEWIQQKLANAKWIVKSRKRLTNLGWFMKSLKEPLARQANKEDGCSGAFWAARYKSVAILDMESLLAVCAYVDLNPVAAGIVPLPENSPYTSIRTRIEHCRARGTLAAVLQQGEQGLPTTTSRLELDAEAELWLCPIEDQRRDRGSDAREGMLKGFTLGCYLRLVDWTSRLMREGKAAVGSEVASIFDRLQTSAAEWQGLLRRLFKPGKLVGSFLGRLSPLQAAARRLGRRWVKNLGGRPAPANTV